MKARSNQKAEPFVKLPRDLLESDAWKEQSLMCRRLIDALMAEHMAHAGKENGEIVKTHRQLEKLGLRRDSIASAIREAEQLGLVNCRRGTRNITSRFTLTWLPHRDGTPASNRWREYRAPAPAARVRRFLPHKMRGRQPHKMRGKTASSAPQNEGQNGQNPAPQNEGHSIEVLTTEVGSVSVYQKETGWCALRSSPREPAA